MAKIVTVKVVADTKDAIQDIDQVSDSLKQLDSQSKKATDAQEGLTDQVTKNGGAMALLNAVTGGAAQQFKDAYEASALFTQGLKGMTLAQIRLNVAMAINPLTVAATGVLALGAAIVEYGSSITDGVVSRTETFMNLIKSIGNPLGFAARQAESYAKGLVAIKDAQDELQLDRSIKVLQAFGKSTIDLELDLAQRKIQALKEGEEGYDEALTNILVLRARKAKEAGDAEAKAYEDAKQAKLKELQLKWQLEQEADDFAKMFQEELGISEGQAYADAFSKTKVEETKINFGQYQDLLDVQTEFELEDLLNKRKQIQAFEAQKFEITQNALGALANLAGQNSKFGKGLAIVQGIRDTYAGANKALASAPPPFNFVAAGAVIASGLANVRNILSTQEPQAPSFARGASNVGSVSVPSVPTPPAFNVVGQSSASQIADVIAGQNSKPMRAYVVASDVSTAQSLERNIVKGASL